MFKAKKEDTQDTIAGGRGCSPKEEAQEHETSQNLHDGRNDCEYNHDHKNDCEHGYRHHDGENSHYPEGGHDHHHNEDCNGHDSSDPGHCPHDDHEHHQDSCEPDPCHKEDYHVHEHHHNHSGHHHHDDGCGHDHPDDGCGHEHHHDGCGHDHDHEHEENELPALIAGAILFVIGGILTRTGLSPLAAFIVYLAAYVILGGKILLTAGRNILHGQVFDENFLMAVATIGAFAIRQYPEAVGVMLFYCVGEFFEDKAVEQSRRQIMEAVDLRPETVIRISDGIETVIPASEASAGDLLLIRPGDRIPLDGTVVEGESRLDTSPITGEPVPVAVKAGSEILSGCVNTAGQLKIRADKPLSESMVSRILESVEHAAASKPKIDRFITRFARIYTPCVVFAALAVAVIPSLVSGRWHYWIFTALTFLVMSCPCALVLSVPLAFFSGIGAGSKAGILFKGGLAMESLSRIRTVVMDKTGTLTEGNFHLQKIIPAGTWTETELLSICAGCEQRSSHPIAESITAAAREQGLEIREPARLEEIAGCGIRAQTDVGTVLCGNRKLMDTYGIAVTGSGASYGSEVYLAINGTFAGTMVISDTIKKDAVSAVRRLKSMGIHTVMLTGDSRESAEAVARETGIDEVFAKLLPQEKLDTLASVREKHGSAMFVGDGINDAPVLAGADVGAAMGSGADAAIEAADAVFMTSAAESIPQSVSIARTSNRIARQNVVIALAIKIAVMIIGLSGHANMWLAVFADTGVAAICVLNSIRALYQKPAGK